MQLVFATFFLHISSIEYHLITLIYEERERERERERQTQKKREEREIAGDYCMHCVIITQKLQETVRGRERERERERLTLVPTII